MNCKPGDMAIIVSAKPKDEKYIGRIVKVTTPFCIDSEWYWEYENEELHKAGFTGIWDGHLRPIRDSDKEDEMLRIVKITEEV